jgi:hypothetical protein
MNLALSQSKAKRLTLAESINPIPDAQGKTREIEMTDPIDPKTVRDPENPEGNRTFTQEDVDGIVKDRLNREHEKYKDYDDLKTKAQKFTEAEEAQKSELQKATEAKQAAEAQRDAALQKANERMIRAEFISAASGLDVAHPEDAYALADKADVSITEDGKVVGAAEAVKALVDGGRLPLKTKPKAPGLNGGAGGGRDEDRPVELSVEEKQIAARLGVKPEDYAKQKLAKVKEKE